MSAMPFGPEVEALHQKIVEWLGDDAANCSGYTLDMDASGLPTLTMKYFPTKKILGSSRTPGQGGQ